MRLEGHAGEATKNHDCRHYEVNKDDDIEMPCLAIFIFSVQKSLSTVQHSTDRYNRQRNLCPRLFFLFFCYNFFFLFPLDFCSVFL